MDTDQPSELISNQSLKSTEAIDAQSDGSSDIASDESCKQLLFKLTPYVLIPETPARQTSEFFDSINNLDPIKFSPPECNQTPTKSTMSNA